MIVSCKMQQCPYHSEYDFCAKPIAVNIDDMGMCTMLWRKGQQRMPFTEQIYPKEKIIVIEPTEKEIYNINEEQAQEGGGSRSKDPINDAAAHGDS